MDLDTLASCADLTAEDAAVAARSSADIRRLLARAAEIARPGEGAPKVLMAIGALADAAWLEGELSVELFGSDAGTMLDVFCDHGFGIRERLLPQTYFAVPIDEFARAVELAPKLASPLRATHLESRIHLSREGTRSSVPPLEFELEEESLVAEPEEDAHEKKTAPPVANVELPADRDEPSVHTRPTVRRMIAVDPAALRPRSGDPGPDER